MRGASDPVARGTELNAVPGIRGSLTRGLTSRRTARRQSEAEMPWLLRLWRKADGEAGRGDSRPPQKNRAARLSKTRNIQTHGNRRPERRAASPLPSDSIRGVVFSSLTSAADAPWRRRRSPQRVPGNREAIIRGPETAAPLQTGSRTMAAPFPGAEREKGKKERHPPTDPGLEPGEDRRTQFKSPAPRSLGPPVKPEDDGRERRAGEGKKTAPAAPPIR